MGVNLFNSRFFATKKMKNNQLNKNLLIFGDNLKALDDLKKKRM